jgi:hypothetical protein
MEVNIEKIINMTNWAGDGLSNTEGELLYSLVKGLPEDQVVVVIGRRKGKTVVWLSRDSIADSTNRGGIRPRSEIPNVIKANEEDSGNVNTSYSDSEFNIRRWKSKVGVLFINDYLEYEDIKNIFLNWERHLAPDARVIVRGFDQPGPARIIKEYLGKLGDFTFDKSVGTLKVIRIDK